MGAHLCSEQLAASGRGLARRLADCGAVLVHDAWPRIIFKLAYDEEYYNCRPAPCCLRTCSGMRSTWIGFEIDYPTGDDAYKQSWMTQRRQRTGILACNQRRPAGCLSVLRSSQE